MNFSLDRLSVGAAPRAATPATVGNLALASAPPLPCEALAKQGHPALDHLLDLIQSGRCDTSIVRRDPADIERLFRTGAEIVTSWDAETARMLVKARPTAFADFPPEEQVLAREKASWVAEVEGYRRKSGQSEAEAVRVVASRRDLWPTLRNKAKLTKRNFREWRSAMGRLPNGRLDTTNLKALVREYDRGPRTRPGHPDWWRLWMTMYLDANKRSKRDCWDYACRLWRETVPIHNAADLPTYKQLADWTHKYLPVALQSRLREGREYFANHEAGYVNRDWSAVAVNEIWFGDHHQLDLWIRVPDGAGGWTAVRPWLTAWRDAKSGYFLSWRIVDRSPNHLDILATVLYGLAVTGGRPPAWFYTDQGADYKKPGLFAPVEIGGKEYSIATALGSRWKEARGYNGREKPIERDFQPVCDWFARWCPGYCGNSFVNRPEAIEEIRTRHPDRLWDIDELRAHFAVFVRDILHARPRPDSIITDGRPPEQVFQEIPASSIPLDRDALFLATLWPLKLAPVGRGCEIEVAHPVVKRRGRRDRRYRAEQLYHYKGKRDLLVKVSPWTDSAIFVFDPEDGTPIATATRTELAAPIGADAEVLARISHGNARLGKQVMLDFAAFTQGLPDHLQQAADNLVALPPPADPPALHNVGGDLRAATSSPLPLDIGRADTAALDAYLDQVDPDDLDNLDTLVLTQAAPAADPDVDDLDVEALDNLLSKGPTPHEHRYSDHLD